MPVLSCIELSLQQQLTLADLISTTIINAVSESTLKLPSPDPPTQALQQPIANFVTLYVAQKLRGCIGSTRCDQPLWQSACLHAYACIYDDDRFLPVQPDELDQLNFSVSLLSEMQPIISQGEKALLETLEVGQDGLLLQQGEKSALFLPSVWQKLPQPKLFLQYLKQKGGWDSNDWQSDIQIFKFRSWTFNSYRLKPL